MARKFTGADVRNWKVITYAGKILNYPASADKAGKPMVDLKGYGDAMRYAKALGAVAVRV